MLVAKQKRSENIAEYILYLYQVEELIRAFKFDLNLIDQRLVAAYKVDEKTSDEIRNWYSNLVIMMDKEGIREKGHMQFLKNLISDVNDFHLRLMSDASEKVYIQNFQMVTGLLAELKLKNKSAENDVQLALDTVYGFLLLKMKQADVSKETAEAVKRLSQWLGILSKLYKDFEKGDFSF